MGWRRIFSAAGLSHWLEPMAWLSRLCGFGAKARAPTWPAWMDRRCFRAQERQIGRNSRPFYPPPGCAPFCAMPAAAVHLPAFPVQADGVVLARMREGGAAVPEHELNPGPRELYSLLKQCETNTFRAPPFEGFYLDLSHRTRHGAAVSVAVRENGGELAACAFSTVQTASLAVISGVAVRPGCRQGPGQPGGACAAGAPFGSARVCLPGAGGERGFLSGARLSAERLLRRIAGTAGTAGA